jgi:hypothetical protein
MFGSNTLEVAIGIVFVYLLLSLFCTAVNESVAATIQHLELFHIGTHSFMPRRLRKYHNRNAQPIT